MVVASEAVLPIGLVEGPREVVDHGARMRAARDRFLCTAEIAPDVRPEIAASWRRSTLCGLSPMEVQARYSPEMKFGGQLMRVARPVLEEREHTLKSTRCGIVLTDGEARVLARWGSDYQLERDLTSKNVIPGFCLAESAVGTNSAALVLETGLPSEVHGAEHFAADYLAFRTAGSPIVHPSNHRLLGTLNIACRTVDATPMLMPWLLEVVREIERRLRGEDCVHEQVLLESYLAARRNCRHAVVCLNDQTILSNSAAARLLGTVDQALLWEQASRAIDERANDVSILVLSDGQRVSAHCCPIFDGTAAVGAKIEIQLDQMPRAAARQAPSATSEPLEGLAGHGVRWQKLCAELTTAKAAGRRLLLVGEAGTGKLAIAQALFEGETIDVFDAALHKLQASGWVRQLHERLQHPFGVVVLAHLDALDVFTARTVSSLLHRAGDAPRIVGTVTTADGEAQLHGAPLDAFEGIVAVPALRDRLEDLRDLLRTLTDRHCTGEGTWQWMPDAIQTLSRIDWLSNVRTLEVVVRHVVAGRTPGYIDARSLPASVRAAGSRRRLSRLEQVEAAAITEALQHSQDNKLEAAERLGIARSTLYRRMRSLGLDLSEANY
jgi:transcriptional regulator of acetoin/glycerol metabolism